MNKYFWVIIGICLGIPSTPILAANVLSNPGFEFDGQGQSQNLPGWTIFGANAYTETGPTGANSFALSYASRSVNVPDFEVGFRNATDLPVARNWVLHLTDKFAFEHAADSSFDVQAAYAALPGSNFTTFGAQPGKNMARVALGAELKSRYGLSTGLTFEEAVSSRSQSYDGVFSFGYGW